MQTFCGGIETDIGFDVLLCEDTIELFCIGALMDESSCVGFLQDFCFEVFFFFHLLLTVFL